MRTLGLLLLGALAARAQEVDPLTAKLPASALEVVRLPSLERLDAIAAKDLRDLVAVLPGEGDLLKGKASKLLLSSIGATPEMGVDRTRPLYVVFVDGDPVFALPAGPASVLVAERALDDGRVAVPRDGLILIGPKGRVAGKARGAPLAMAAGDVAIHLALGERIAANRKDIDEFLDDLDIKDDVDARFHGLIDRLTKLAKDALADIESLDYALVLKDGRLESTGWLKPRARSGLSRFLAGAGPPRKNDLAGRLADRFFVASDSALAPAWPVADLKAVVDAELGAGASAMLLPFLGPAAVCAETMTGRNAGVANLIGLGGSRTIALFELKDPDGARKALKGIDGAAINKQLADLGIPMSFQYQRAASKHGEIELHRLSYRFKTDQAMLAMLASTQSYLAVQGNYLVMATSVTAERDLKAFLDKLKEDKPAEHPHLAAMKLLGGERNYGFTFDLGALKPFFGFAVMAEKDLLPIMQAIPARMLMSTSVMIGADGIRWRGDWPLKEGIAITAAAVQLIKDKELEDELEKEFD
ncbi:MAG: hypothetical protein ACYTGN_06890 [Planctomycetota bacterium]